MAYLPKGIGDHLIVGFDFGFQGNGPEWPTCRKALVTLGSFLFVREVVFGPEWPTCRKALVTRFLVCDFLKGFVWAGMAYLPKGIGDRGVSFETGGGTTRPEWPTCRKALVTAHVRQSIHILVRSAGMAYLPKGIGDPTDHRALSFRAVTAGMAYLPKGIGDKKLLGIYMFHCTVWPEWPTCRKALVTRTIKQELPLCALWPEWPTCRKALVTLGANG